MPTGRASTTRRHRRNRLCRRALAVPHLFSSPFCSVDAQRRPTPAPAGRRSADRRRGHIDNDVAARTHVIDVFIGRTIDHVDYDRRADSNHGGPAYLDDCCRVVDG